MSWGKGAQFSLMASAFLVSCDDSLYRDIAPIEATAEATLTVSCSYGCQNWAGYEEVDSSNSDARQKTFVLQGEGLRHLKGLRLQDSCASTPVLYVRIVTDTGFKQSWPIAIGENDSLLGMCTSGRTRFHDAKFKTFFKTYVVGSE